MRISLDTSESKLATSVISRLRDLMPQRSLTFTEAQRLAELQAATLLRMVGVSGGRVSEQLIAELPRLDVQYRPGLIGSGLTTWERGAWRIGINADEPAVRQRFTLAHELKHVLDASHEDAVYRHLSAGQARERHIEAICDHFAACLLMPRPWVKRLWGDGTQELSLLAAYFDVSQQAMLIRLQHLGLMRPLPRCVPAIGRVAVAGTPRPNRHHRSLDSGPVPARSCPPAPPSPGLVATAGLPNR
jgi:predicted transcriptional regulator